MADDHPGRVIGSAIGKNAWVKAQEYIVSSKKARICHIPPGHPSRARTLTVASTALAAHLAHGDQMGACSSGESRRWSSRGARRRGRN